MYIFFGVNVNLLFATRAILFCQDIHCVVYSRNCDTTNIFCIVVIILFWDQIFIFQNYYLDSNLPYRCVKCCGFLQLLSDTFPFETLYNICVRNDPELAEFELSCLKLKFCNMSEVVQDVAHCPWTVLFNDFSYM